MEGNGGYIVLRSTEDGSQVRAYTVDSKWTADKLFEDFTLLGFKCRVVDCDEEFARA